MTAPAAPEDLATLLVSCPDQPGLVAALAQLLYGHGANILDADQQPCAHATGTFKYVKRLPTGPRSVNPLNAISTD